MKMSSANAFILDKAKLWWRVKQVENQISDKHHYNPFPHKPLFAVKVFWKKVWEKEKLLVASDFSFSNNVFYLFEELSATFIKFENVVCKLFQFGNG